MATYTESYIEAVVEEQVRPAIDLLRRALTFINSEDPYGTASDVGPAIRVFLKKYDAKTSETS